MHCRSQPRATGKHLRWQENHRAPQSGRPLVAEFDLDHASAEAGSAATANAASGSLGTSADARRPSCGRMWCKSRWPFLYLTFWRQEFVYYVFFPEYDLAIGKAAEQRSYNYR